MSRAAGAKRSTPPGSIIPPDPGRVLRLSLVAWGLGEIALGNRRGGVAWLVAEGVALLLVIVTSLSLADGTAYLAPFLLGSGFVVAWGLQAVLAYRAALHSPAAAPGGDPGPSVGPIAWLGVPLLAWGTLFWLLAAHAATPAAVTDAFLRDWHAIAEQPGRADPIASRPDALAAAAASALERLRERCADAAAGTACPNESGLFRDVRVRLLDGAGTLTSAAIELVRYERRPSELLGFSLGSELVPVTEERLLTLRLATRPDPGPLGIDVGARRWWIVGADS